MLFSNLKTVIFTAVVLIPGLICAQFQKGQFFSHLVLGANFCQIDGDQASGYNKFGFTAGYMVGQGLGEAREGGWAYLTGGGFSVRGSRRPFDPENPAMQSFHLVFQMIDIPVFIARYYKSFSFSAGLRTCYVLKAEDVDGFILGLQDGIQRINILGCLGLDWKAATSLRVFAEAQYSINSIRKGSSNPSVFYPTGVYHNVISIGAKWHISGDKQE